MEQKKEKKKENFEKLKKDLEQVEKVKNDYLAGWQRSQADFLNYKKQEMERIEQLLKFAQQEVFFKLLPILDNFDLAEKKLPADLKNNENVKGLMQIKNQLKDFLKNNNLEEIESVGQKFDPQIHEAVDQIETTEQESGTIVEEVQKGYKINGQLLRPAKVKIVK